jgi:hypothetical protein
MIAECITVRPTDALKSVKREWHTRKRGSRYGCYFLEDKHGTFLIVSQKLQAIVAYLNAIAPDVASRVSVTALYEIIDTCDNRVGGWSKHRWRLRFAPLEDAGEVFECERRRFERPLILGQPDCYTFESCM